MQTQQQVQGGGTAQGRRVAVLMTDGVEQVEYTEPRSFLEQHGVQVTLVSPKKAGEQVQGFHHLAPADQFRVELALSDAKVASFDMLVLPGGVANPDTLRLNQLALDFIAGFHEAGKPIAAICHGPWPLIDAGVIESRHVTSWPSLKTDLRNAGAEWSDEAVVVDGGLITSRNPGDLPAFNQALLDQLQVLAPEDADIGPSS